MTAVTKKSMVFCTNNLNIQPLSEENTIMSGGGKNEIHNHKT